MGIIVLVAAVGAFVVASVGYGLYVLFHGHLEREGE